MGTSNNSNVVSGSISNMSAVHTNNTIHNTIMDNVNSTLLPKNVPDNDDTKFNTNNTAITTTTTPLQLLPFPIIPIPPIPIPPITTIVDGTIIPLPIIPPSTIPIPIITPPLPIIPIPPTLPIPTPIPTIPTPTIPTTNSTFPKRYWHEDETLRTEFLNKCNEFLLVVSSRKCTNSKKRVTKCKCLAGMGDGATTSTFPKSTTSNTTSNTTSPKTSKSISTSQIDENNEKEEEQSHETKLRNSYS